MSRSQPLFVLLGCLAFVACAGPDQSAEQRLHARLDALDERLDAVDARLGDLAREQASGQRLRDDLQALDRRLGALDAKTTEALDSAAKAASSRPSAPATTGKAAPAGEPSAARQAPKVDPQERRAQLGDLMNEYRRRLSELQTEQGTADPAARLAARRQVREWYLARRRALLLGTPLHA